MGRRGLSASVVLLATLLAGCTGDGPDFPAQPSGARDAAPAQVNQGQDLGNGRPAVSYDGLMVRRRVVIAVHSDIYAEQQGVRAKLDAAAAARNMILDAASPTVLEPAALQQVTPELVVALPASATLDDGRALVDRAVGEGAAEGTETLAAEHFHVLPVLVHDLRFSVETTSPAAVSAAVDKEGILSDALGNYGTAVGSGQVTFSYTGPLLGDGTVESVRAGIARQAHVAASAVAVGPRSPAGTGVDMAAEPPWDPEVIEEKAGHAHG
jgi:hypothetical protein